MAEVEKDKPEDLESGAEEFSGIEDTGSFEIADDEPEVPVEVREEPARKRRKSTRIRSSRIRGVTRRASKKSKKVDRLEPVLEGTLKNKPFMSVCSECYEEFTLDPVYNAEQFNCPECDHPAQGPDEEFLRKYYGAKKNENFYLMMAIICFTAIFAILLVWQLLLVDTAIADETVFNWGFPFLLLVAFGCGTYFGIRYEIRRYETYF